MRHIQLTVNGQAIHLIAPSHKTLMEVLREDLRLTGTKHGCELGECGSCCVLVDGVPQLSCLVLPAQIQGSEVTTIEAMAGPAGLSPLQQAFAELGAAQCGYCTPGVLLVAEHLLRQDPCPSRQRIRSSLAGNICRCTGYSKIVAAIELGAARMLERA